jgi:site-specific DNA-methyltransferase (adenine-specific)
MKDKIYLGDCLEVMEAIPDESIDMVLCDLPYGITKCKWDSVIPLDKLWKQYKRIMKVNGAIVFTAVQPFTTILINSHLDGFKHTWIWDKVRPSGMQIVKYKPMQRHEDIVVFTASGDKVNYYPIMEKRDAPVRSKIYSYSPSSPITSSRGVDNKVRYYDHKYPQSIVRYVKDTYAIHPTQKPVALFSYLIRNYTLPGELVLDNCAGSGTTAIACLNTGRDFILIEKDAEYYRICQERVQCWREVDED